MSRQLKLKLESPRKLSYEELYAELWRKQARLEGHRPGFPEPKERYVGTPPSQLEDRLCVYLKGKGPLTTAEIGEGLGWHRKRVAETLYTLERKGKASRADKIGHSQRWMGV